MSVVFSVDPLISVYHAIRLLLLFGLYLYVLNEIAALSQLILPVVIQVLIQASISVSQILSQHSLGLTSLGELELDPAWSGVSIILADGVRSLRAYGLSDHPNILGGCFAFALILIAGWYSDSNTRWRTMTAMVFALGGIGLLLTFSRSAWLALAGGLLFSALLLGRTRQRQPLREWLMLMVVSFIFLLPWGWHNAAQLGVRFNQQNSFEAVDSIGRAIEGRSLAERNVLNEATSQLFAAHALFGVGLGALPRALHDAYPDFPFYYQPAHIALLDVAAETGSIGALFYFIVMATPWLALGFNRARLTFSPALIAASGTLLALTLVGLFDYYTWLLAPGRLWQWLGWGLWGTIYLASLNGDRCA